MVSKVPLDASAGSPIEQSSGSKIPDRSQNDIARLAHELRTPLGAIAILAEIMRDERLGPLGGPRYKAYAADIHSSAAHANAVLANWLEPAVGDEKPAGALDFVELDLALDLAPVVSSMAPLADRAGVIVDFEPQPGLPHVIADRRSVRQMLTNLVTNALKYTPPGGRVRIGVSYTAGGPVILDVTDTGDGMTPAELQRARRADATGEALRRRSGGTGIGLPLVRTLAAACGAQIEIESAERRGTRASILFPHDRVVPV